MHLARLFASFSVYTPFAFSAGLVSAGLITTGLLLSSCDDPLQLVAVTPAVVALPAGAADINGDTSILMPEITITGTGLSDETLFFLESAGFSAALGGAQINDDGTSATMRIPRAAIPDLYSIRASNGDADVILPDALELTAETVQFYFLDVGQGDSTLIITPHGHSVIIDGGPRSAEPVVTASVAAFAGGQLDAAILSHHDADHLGGLVGLLRGDDGEAGTDDDMRIDIRRAASDGETCTSNLCFEFEDLQTGLFDVAEAGEEFDIDGVSFRIVAVDGHVAASALAGATTVGVSEDNERSAVVEVTYGGRRVLILGDLTGGGLSSKNVELPLAERTGPIDVLRTGHHGSLTSSNEDALALWQPSIAIISVGTDNPFCHPHPTVVGRLAATGADVYATGFGMIDSSGDCDVTAAPDDWHMGSGTVVVSIDAAGQIGVASESILGE